MSHDEVGAPPTVLSRDIFRLTEFALTKKCTTTTLPLPMIDWLGMGEVGVWVCDEVVGGGDNVYSDQTNLRYSFIDR